MSPSTHSADVSQIQTDTTAILVDTGTTIPATIATVDNNVDAILVDTGTTIPATIATVDGNVDAILVDTGTTLPNRLGGALTIANSSATVLAYATAVEVMSGTLDLPYEDAVLFGSGCAYGNTLGDVGEFYATKGGVVQNIQQYLVAYGNSGDNWAYFPLGRFSNGDAWAFYVKRTSYPVGTGYVAAQMSSVFATQWFPDGAPA